MFSFFKTSAKALPNFLSPTKVSTATFLGQVALDMILNPDDNPPAKQQSSKENNPQETLPNTEKLSLNDLVSLLR